MCGACEVELAKTEEPCPICRADLNAGAVEDVARLRKLLDGDNRPPGRHTCRAMYILGDYYFHGTGWAHMHVYVISACPTLSGYVLKIIEDPSPTEAMSCHCIHKQEQRTYVIIINTYCPLAIVPGLAATCGNGRPFYAGNCNNDVHIAIET